MRRFILPTAVGGFGKTALPSNPSTEQILLACCVRDQLVREARPTSWAA